MENREIRMVMVDKLRTLKDVLSYNPEGNTIGIQLLKQEIEAYEKVIDLLDLVEMGRMVELPCAIGDTIFYIFGEYRKTGEQPQIVEGAHVEESIMSYSDIPKLGDTIFPTKAEAEARLAELKGAK